MSNLYTTGEMAKLCGVSVRTVQYYDSRGILIPSELSEGGRRLYSEEDLKKMKIICFLRNIGLSINSIGELLEEDNSSAVISLLLGQQAQVLEEEIRERREKLQKVEEMTQELKLMNHISVESIGDIAYMMENKKKLKKVHTVMLAVGIPMDIIEVGTIWYWVETGNWIPFAIGMPIVIALAVWVSRYYFKHTVYICPECHEVFRPSFRQAFFASHTPKTRRLTCPSCGKKSFCVETYGEDATE